MGRNEDDGSVHVRTLPPLEAGPRAPSEGRVAIVSGAQARPGRPEQVRMTHAEWHAEGERRFGPDELAWRFECPSCGHIAAIKDWKDAGFTSKQAAFVCVGRKLPNAVNIFQRPGPCNYTGGGLFGLNPVTVVFPDGEERPVFAFADEGAAPT